MQPAKSLEATLWEAADKLRGNLEAAEYKHIVLGLVFLKYVSDAFTSRRVELERSLADPDSSDYIPSEVRRERLLESRDEYTSHSVFWVPERGRWEYLLDNAKQPGIGQFIDEAMDLIEYENPSLKGVLPKNYGRADLDKRLLGELVDLIGTIGFTEVDHGSDDVLGKVYEYFLGKFAGQEGRGAGEFYTPRSVVRLLVEMVEPYQGRVYDPCCGSGGMFVQSEEFVLAHGGRRDDIAIYGQEFVGTTWKLAKMNLAIRGIEANLGDRSEDSFHRDLHPDLRADFILANPPFNKDDWYSAALADDPRWKFGTPPASNANFAWVQHIVHHLAPAGRAGFVLANMALSSDSNDERSIRSGLIDSNLVDCIVTLPDRLFLSTPIPVSLWFLDKGRAKRAAGEILFIDASRLGQPLSRTHQELRREDSEAITQTYRQWREQDGYRDEAGFCTAVPVEEVRRGGYGLLPATYLTGMVEHFIANNDLGGALVSMTAKQADGSLAALAEMSGEFGQRLRLLRKQARDLETKVDHVVAKLGDVLELSNDRLGNADEPEILTCTEGSGLVFQRERFAKRVATENTAKYKVVRRGDIVYNPYLLWKGSIDQCWIVDYGITSPAYEVFHIREGVSRTLIGNLLTSKEMIRRYDGISFGTIQRRRRAAPENFLSMEVRIPVGKGAEELDAFLEVVRACQIEAREAATALRDLVGVICQEFG